MNGRRKPRQPRRIVCNVIDVVRTRHSRLMPHEIAAEMTSVHEAHQALRAQVATSTHYAVLEGRLQLAMAIERQGIARGIHGHLVAAERSLHAIYDRATSAGAWRAVEVQFDELEHVAELVWLHEWQLGQLSASELQAAHRKLVAQICAAGGQVIEESPAHAD